MEQPKNLKAIKATAAADSLEKNGPTFIESFDPKYDLPEEDKKSLQDFNKQCKNSEHCTDSPSTNNTSNLKPHNKNGNHRR